ncbi:MAG TPA: sigma-70 family RNA polymerase sigma factor [Gammaproteobacteria bacterium]|nr:sigma-70 family RNA polymerase sigma factor [Gammaproteobacteria bacterium]
MQPQSAGLAAAFADVRGRLRDYLRRRLPDAAIADDALQDIFVKALASEAAGRAIGNLTGWLYAAARTTIADHYRAAQVPMEEVSDELAEAEPDELAAHQALATCLRPMVERLPPIYRNALIATELEGKTMRAVAEQEGVSVSAIKSRAARGRAMLRDAVLECCEVELADGVVSDYRRIEACRDPGCN